jgi:hypothetical protein
MLQRLSEWRLLLARRPPALQWALQLLEHFVRGKQDIHPTTPYLPNDSTPFSNFFKRSDYVCVYPNAFSPAVDQFD